MVGFLSCFAVWFVIWMLWYRIEWKTLERDNPNFTDDDRRDIFIGSMTWPIQVLLLVAVGPFVLIAQKMGWWESKEDEEDKDE